MLATGAILLVTLIPGLRTSGGAFPRTPLERTILDVVGNIALFAPLGAGLAWFRLPLGVAVLIGAGLSAAVEVGQLILPGRVASPIDLASNTLGTLLGFAVVRIAPILLAPSRSQQRRVVLGGGAAAAVAMLATGWLLGPALGSEVWRGLFTPRMTWYRTEYTGRVVASRLDGIEMNRSNYADLSSLAPRFRRDFELHLDLIAGEPPPGRAPLFLALAERHHHLLELAAFGHDLVLQYQSRGKLVGFEPAQLWFRETLRGVKPGEELPLELERRGEEFCVALSEKESCQGLTLGDGWQLVVPYTPALAAHRTGLGALWLALLCLPLGYWGRRDLATAGAWSLVAAALLLVPAVSVLLPTPPLQALGALAVGAAGAVARIGSSGPPRSAGARPADPGAR